MMSKPSGNEMFLVLKTLYDKLAAASPKDNICLFHFIRQIESDVYLTYNLQRVVPLAIEGRKGLLDLVLTLKCFEYENLWMTWTEILHCLFESCSGAFSHWKDLISQQISKYSKVKETNDVESAFRAYKRKLDENLPTDLKPAIKVSTLLLHNAASYYYTKIPQYEDKTKKTLDEISRIEMSVSNLRIDRSSNCMKFQSRTGLKEKFRARYLTPLEVNMAIEMRIRDEQRQKEIANKIVLKKKELTPEEEQIVAEAFDGSDSEVVAEVGKTSLIRKSYRRLEDCQWLNDEVINSYLQILAQRDKEACEKDSTRKPSHFFNSFFLSMLCQNGYNYGGVRRWTRKAKVDIFLLDKVFIPANVGNLHWALVVIFIQERRIQYYDSMGGLGTTFLKNVRKWLADEHMDKKGVALENDSWELVSTVVEDTPQQQNGWDCGIFCIMFADFICDDLTLKFEQKDMRTFRKRVALQLLQHGNT